MVKKTVGYVQYASIYILINKRLFACSYVCIKLIMHKMERTYINRTDTDLWGETIKSRI